MTMDTEYKLRLTFNHDSLKKAFERFEEAIRVADNQKIYTAIGELLLWTMTTDTWHKEHRDEDYSKHKESDDDGKLLFGMAHAFNCFKHNMKFFQIHHKRGGMTFPMRFPVAFVTNVVWINAGDILEGKYFNQKQNYIKYLEGKDVKETFEKVIDFLNKEYSMITLD